MTRRARKLLLFALSLQAKDSCKAESEGVLDTITITLDPGRDSGRNTQSGVLISHISAVSSSDQSTSMHIHTLTHSSSYLTSSSVPFPSLRFRFNHRISVSYASRHLPKRVILKSLFRVCPTRAQGRLSRFHRKSTGVTLKRLVAGMDMTIDLLDLRKEREKAIVCPLFTYLLFK